MENLPATQTGIAIKSEVLMLLSDSPKKFYDNLQVSTVDDALRSASPPLVTIRAELGEQKLLAILTLFITDAVKFFNVGKSMSAEQIVQTAKLIAKDYFYLKPEDFRLCFDNAKRGRYGPIFDRLDGAVIFGWLDAYAGTRMSRGEELSQAKHNEERFIDMQRSRGHREKAAEHEREFHKVAVREYARVVGVAAVGSER